MNPRPCELFRALLRRALGGRSVTLNLVLALAVGLATGWATGRCLAAGLGARPSAGLLAWLLVRFDRTAMYGLGGLAALQLATAYHSDARSGWTVQYIAAGASRDRYILALAGAQAAASALLYLLAVGAWLAAATLLGRPTSQLAGSTAGLPAALIWLCTPAAFAAAAVALTSRGGRAVGLMIGLLVLPWLALAAVRPDPDLGPPVWLPWATAVAPPYPFDGRPAMVALCLAYAAAFLGVAWALAPRRLLRV